jgi:hypothetical protein
MIRKLLIVVAFLGMIGSFVLTIRDIHRLAARACGTDESGGNCMAFAHYYSTNDISIFAVFAILMAALLLFSLLRPTGK